MLKKLYLKNSSILYGVKNILLIPNIENEFGKEPQKFDYGAGEKFC